MFRAVKIRNKRWVKLDETSETRKVRRDSETVRQENVDKTSETIQVWRRKGLGLKKWDKKDKKDKKAEVLAFHVLYIKVRVVAVVQRLGFEMH